MGLISEYFVVTILTIFILLLTTIYFYFKYSYKYWSKGNVAHLQPVFPLGNARQIFLQAESIGESFANLYNELKRKTTLAGGLYFFSKPVLMLIDPELIKTILTNDFGSFHDRDFYVDEENDPLSGHLVGLRGICWRNLRAKLTPTFTSGKMKMMFHTMIDCTKDLTALMKGYADRYEAIDMREIFGRLTTDSIMSCAFGIDCNSFKNPDNDFRKYGKMIFDIGFRSSVVNALANYPWILKFLKVPFNNPAVTKFFVGELRNIVEYREKNNIHRKDFLDLLIRLKNNQSVLDDSTDAEHCDSGSALTFNEMAAQAFVFYAAGFETTSSTLNFCIFELASNPEIQRQVRKEVRKVLSEHDGVLSYEAVMSMKYMAKVVQEVLRKYPPLPVLSRECSKDYHIPELGYTVKKGTSVAVSTLGLQQDPEHYPQPDKFDPERFSEEGKAQRHPFTYLPFGEGPRICIGMRFALLQVKLVLSVLMKDFEFSLDPKTVTPIRFNPNALFLAPTHTIWLQARLTQN